MITPDGTAHDALETVKGPMVQFNFDFYTSIPLSASEVRSLLSMTRDSYEIYVDKGLLTCSVDLCLDRPGRFLAHNFWDIIRLDAFLSLRGGAGESEATLLAVIDHVLEDIALIMDSAPTRAVSEKYIVDHLPQIVSEHAVSVFPRNVAGAISSMLEAWRRLEEKISRCIGGNLSRDASISSDLSPSVFGMPFRDSGRAIL